MDDLISRQATKLDISRWKGYIDDDMIARMHISIDKLPPATPQQKVGRWIPYKIENEKKVVLNDDLSKEETLQQQDWEERYEPCYICSCCGKADFYSNYCPDCGAKMVDPQESEDKK